MSRIREGRTWKFHCNLYIKCQDLVVQFSVVLWVGKLSLVVWTTCRVSEKVAHGSFIVICIKCKDLVVQFSVVLWVGKLILVVRTTCRVSEKVAHGSFIIICIKNAMQRFGGPVFSSALSRKTNFSSSNSMSRIREGRTWRSDCNLYTCNLTRFLKIKRICHSKFVFILNYLFAR